VKFKDTVRETMINKGKEFYYVDKDGEEIHYKIDVVNANYVILRETPTELVRTYEFPNKEHWLGLDNNGMDLLTRLMYGGRVSLLVGFVVIIIEMLIGVIVGGISGYFGGVVDTILMRFVDLFNSIPFYPIVVIFGSVMDALQVDSVTRIFLLMAILGILGWTGIARVVRGQILSLREQDFMTATEATGIRTSRRIFRHLVPNVMPLLIVSATAGLGGLIITEATLGFLGLGVKYPLASWGSIINNASSAHVMQTYWFMWFPAGMLILLTVLGFNFVGDGLRDAYDPKMKR
ncbi:MAG TPA: ABC transporter permease, partial [Anaerolineaceae bacterium]|nr:ABC transporter permease [Anaerolineaceae bacterium]